MMTEQYKKQPVTVVLIGTGGYGALIGTHLLPLADAGEILLVGAVDPAMKTSPLQAEFAKRGVPCFDTPEQFYETQTAELAVICTPIPFHAAHCILAMRHGSDVLCEKPTAATLPQSDEMAAVAKETGRRLHIGFQLSYVPPVLRFKADIAAGLFGKPRRLSALICWPRNSAYYARAWCAKIKWQGQYVLDSIAMNACAHYLHLMYFLLGDRPETAAVPTAVDAIVCRTNEIETFDTAMFRATANGVPLHFLATHACEHLIQPHMRFEFEHATVEMTTEGADSGIRVLFNDGTKKDYGELQPHTYDKLAYCCAAVRGAVAPLCTPQTARSHLMTVDAVTELVPVVSLAGMRDANDVMVFPGLDAQLKAAFEAGKMPWELTDAFGVPTHIDLTTYQWSNTL